MGMKGSGRRNSGALCVVAKHAGARLQNCVTCELKMGGRVGRIPVCVSLLPVCGRHGVDLLSVERRADNHEGSLPAPGTVGESSKNRAHESSRLAQQGHLARPCCLLKGLLPCFCLQVDFSGHRDAGLPRTTKTPWQGWGARTSHHTEFRVYSCQNTTNRPR